MCGIDTGKIGNHLACNSFLMVLSLMIMSYLQDRSSPKYGPLHTAGIALLAECSQTVDQEVGTLCLA